MALQLKRADPGTASEAIAAFGAFWREHGQHHFEIEERVLLPVFTIGGGDPHDGLLAQVLTDHVEIRAKARGLAEDSPLADLHQLGERLSAHVRLEEDKLFPMIERTLDPDALAALRRELELEER